jgi:excisionase family DNA binding protein
MKPRLLRPRKRVKSIPVGRPVMPELMTVAQVAMRLHTSPDQIHTLCRSGAMASVMVGRKRWISEAQFLAFIEKHTQEAVS